MTGLPRYVHDFLLGQNPADGAAINRFGLGDLSVRLAIHVTDQHTSTYWFRRIEAPALWLDLSELGGFSRHASLHLLCQGSWHNA